MESQAGQIHVLCRRRSIESSENQAEPVFVLEPAPRNQAERRWRRDNEHLDASAGVDGIEAFYEQCVANGVTIIKPLAATAWGTKDFYIEDPDGYIISFGGDAAAG